MGYNFDDETQQKYDIDTLKGEMSDLQSRVLLLEELVKDLTGKENQALGEFMDNLLADDNLSAGTKDGINDIKLY